jgi:hypothetical protein
MRLPAPRLILVALVLATGGVWDLAPALAHPFGTPPSAIISARNRSVFIEWQATADDAITVGVQIGLLPEELIRAYLEGPTQVAPSRADEEWLSASPELRAYLLEHIQVSQNGRRCSATVQPITDFVHGSATVVHECPEPVETVEVRITMLHDAHPAYRTFAVATTDTVPPQAVFSQSNPSHVWTFEPAAGAGDGAAAPAGPGPPLPIVAAALVTLLAVATGLVVVGRSGA